MRVSRTGGLEVKEAAASSPTQQVCLFLLTAASRKPKPGPQKQSPAVHSPGYPLGGDSHDAS